jgi:MarR family transcriptional regulator for hemolysin
MPAPQNTPIGITLTRSARVVEHAFDAALAAQGGSAPVWLILIGLISGSRRNQRELAESIGIQGATLTHHLNAMETSGLLTRHRDPDNRRTHIVELTEPGKALFMRLRAVVTEFDRVLRSGIAQADLDVLTRVLMTMRANLGSISGSDQAR